jgi:hypothetical protein
MAEENAAADASTKADAAEANAIAAADASTKADAAEANAIAAAAADHTTKADAAEAVHNYKQMHQANAIAAAAADATTKADAAEANAIAAAAADGSTTKASGRNRASKRSASRCSWIKRDNPAAADRNYKKQTSEANAIAVAANDATTKQRMKATAIAAAADQLKNRCSGANAKAAATATVADCN